MLVTAAAGAYGYITAEHQESFLRSQIEENSSAVTTAQSQQEVDRSQRKLRQAFSNLDDALGRFGRGEAPPLDIRPNVEEYSDSPTVISARARLDTASSELAALDAPWPAARNALLIGMGIIAVLLLAYWPVQWSRAGFDMEAGRLSPKGRESSSIEPAELQPPESGYNPGRQSNGKIIAIFAGLLIVVATVIYIEWKQTPKSNDNIAAIDNNILPEIKPKITPVILPSIKPVEPAPVAKADLFQPLSRTGKIEQLQCHMDECSWSQVVSATPVRSDDQRLLLKVITKNGSSTHNPEDDPEYPTSYNSSVDIKWDNAPHQDYILCSLSEPKSASKTDEGWIVDSLDVYSGFGYQVSSINAYMLACHGLIPGKWNETRLRALNYKKSEASQSTKTTSEAALSSMW